MAPFVKYDYILRELAASMDLDEDLILNDPACCYNSSQDDG